MKYRRAYTFIVPKSWKPILLTANAHSVGADYSIALSTGTKKIYYVSATAPVEISSPVGINEFLPDRRKK